MELFTVLVSVLFVICVPIVSQEVIKTPDWSEDEGTDFLVPPGRSVNLCQFCRYCRYSDYCFQKCRRGVGQHVCQNRGQCSTECKGFFLRSDPCLISRCFLQQTCVERSPGISDCVCNHGYKCKYESECEQRGANGSCEFYRCFENRRNCGVNGYLLAYGYKYCKLFKEHHNHFNDIGKQMINCVKKCLTKSLVSEYKMDVVAGKRCLKLASSAFKTHIKCYQACNFCEVLPSNLRAVANVYMYQSDKISLTAVKQIIAVGRRCGDNVKQATVTLARLICDGSEHCESVIGLGKYKFYDDKK